MTHNTRYLLIAAFVGLSMPALVPLAYGDPAADYDKLVDRFDDQYNAARYRDAEKTAVQIRRLAEGPLADQPKLLGTALYCQAVAVYKQGRANDAEPLLERALAIREKALGGEHAKVADVLYYLGCVREDQGRAKEAERLYRRAVTIREKAFGPESPKVAFYLNTLAILIADEGHYDEAEPLYRRALAIREKALGPDHLDVAISLNNLGCLLNSQGRCRDAERLHKRALVIREKVLGPEDLDVGHSLNNLAEAYRKQARYADAEPLHRRALAIKEKLLGPDDPGVAWSLNNLALVCHAQGRYQEAERLFQRSLRIKEKIHGPDHRDVATCVNNLATLYHDQGRYAEAETFYKRVLAIREKALAPDHPDVGASLHNLATLCKDLGRYAEAEPLYRRALGVKEKRLGPNHPDVADTLNNLGTLYADLGHYAEAEALHKRALAIREKTLGPAHPDVAQTMNNLAILYKWQRRYAEAEPLYRKSLAVREKALGKDHPEVAASLNNLATLADTQGRYAEAEPLYQRSLAIKQKILGPNHPDVAATLNNLALLYQSQRRYAEAEPLYQRASAIKEKALGPDHPEAATALYNLARLREDQKRYADAEPLVDRAIAVLERTRVDPGLQFQCYRLRAHLAWKAGRRTEAVADLRRAMELAEFQRGQSSGAERERAEFFGSFSGAFETMVAWQAELGDMNEVLAAIERGRARSLLDEINAGGANLHIGRTALEREQLRQRETELKSRIATLARQLDRAGKAPDAEKRGLEDQLADARDALYQHYREQRSTSPVYRNLLSTGTGAPRLSQIQRRLVTSDGLLLVYLFGREGGYVLVVGGADARLVRLDVSPSAAVVLGVDSGSLTADRLHAILIGKAKGVLQHLADPTAAKAAHPKLAALWQLLVPEPQRKELTGGRIRRLIVIPDGPLALLPFETLVVEPGEHPRYLLDVGPAILYGPSATVLLNLSERSVPAAASRGEPVLTVGNPAYSGAAGLVASAADGKLSQLAARSRYSALGGKLTQLPYSGWESSWVADAFAKNELKTTQLEGPKATEARVRAQVRGRRIVHLACHGLADQAYGNFYGALALAPGGNPADPADDGLLTLPEIYELDLKGCELAVLSACETNYGPEQRGEGVWTLSRGFLVAGARRVVASNWLVDDEAAASLVSQFCAGVAQGERTSKSIECADALRNAKRWVRQQEKWSSPYYWGTFVLVGPN